VGVVYHLNRINITQHYERRLCPYVRVVFSSVLFFSRPRSEGWPHHGRPFSIYLSSVILIDPFTESHVHVLMLSIQAVPRVRDLPRLRAPGIVRCIICFSRQLPCFFMV